MTRCTHDCNQGRNCTCMGDEAGRRDLNGGLGYVMIGAFVFWLGLVGGLIWRVW